MDQVGQHWGYPYCFTEYCLSSEVGGTGLKGGNNTIWAWPSFIQDGYIDIWCRENTNPSVISMPSHSAPLGITFYNWKNRTSEEYNNQGCYGGFPKAMDKFAFIAFHDPPTGYKVVFVPFDEYGDAMYQPIDLFRHGGRSEKWNNAHIRPVDVQFDQCGRLFVTEDGTYDGDYLEETTQLSDTDVADGVGCLTMPFPSSTTVLSSSTMTTSFMPVASVFLSIGLAMFLMTL